MTPRTILIAAALGPGLRYFFHTPLARELERRGARLVIATPDPEEARLVIPDEFKHVPIEELLPTPPRRASSLGGLVADATEIVRMVGVSRRASLAIPKVAQENGRRSWARGKRRFVFPVVNGAAITLQRSRLARKLFKDSLARRSPSGAHAALLDKHQPDLVVTTSPGWWPIEADLMREARRRGIRTFAAVPGWDHTSSKGLPAARAGRIAVWSAVQKQELADGYDIDPALVDVAGSALFDVYHEPPPANDREQFFRANGLDADRKLITFVCSFAALSSNVGIVQALARAVDEDRFGEPTQLLIRIHPTHFKRSKPEYRETAAEVDEFVRLEKTLSNVRVAYPEIVPEKPDRIITTRRDLANLASMMRASDVLVTLFSTMVLEAAVLNVPTVSVAMDPPKEWQRDRWLSITQALDWPTHARIIESGTSTVARSDDELFSAIRAYLRDRSLHREHRRAFALAEGGFEDGQSSQRIADIILQTATGGRGA